MTVRFDRLSDILSVKQDDMISSSDRYKLFTGPDVGNTPQKGINWLGNPPNYLHVMSRCAIHSGYSDRWLDASKEIFLYYLMVTNRGSSNAKINLYSKENKALLDQREHGAPILLMIDVEEPNLQIQGRFEVLTEFHDNPIHPGVDSVLLKRIKE
jgi:hypothetical protein